MRLKDYYSLAKNGTQKSPDTIRRIEIKDVLVVGLYMDGEPNDAAIRDTEGNVWIISEGGALVSRHDVGPGMKLTLKLKKITSWATEVIAIK